jgi:hypothetical protein
MEKKHHCVCGIPYGGIKESIRLKGRFRTILRGSRPEGQGSSSLTKGFKVSEWPQVSGHPYILEGQNIEER